MRLRRSLLLFACSCFCLATAGVAQKEGESLLIGPGDMLHVVVFDAPELEQHARVTDSGEFPMLMGGKVKVASLTPEEAAGAMEKTLAAQHYLVNPRISVTVEQYATQNVSVLGEVRNPGAFPITTARSLADVLALAGGLMPDADRNIAVQRRGTGELVSAFISNSPIAASDARTSPVSAHELDKGGILVYPGDTIRVAKTELVFALGDVGRPGGFPIAYNDSKLTVLQLLALAGGTNKSAVPSHARLIHKKPDGTFEEIPIQLSAMQKGKKPDRPLDANDMLYVPFSYIRNAALSMSAIAASTSGAAVYTY